jgi:hypothetical protein
MTEAEWLSCQAPEAMLHLLRDRTTSRKLRLAACTFYRRVWHLLRHMQRQDVEIAERYADQKLDEEALRSVRATYATLGDVRGIGTDYDTQAAYCASREAANAGGRGARDLSCVTDRHPIWKAAFNTERNAHAEILREIFGNPFRPITISPTWRTSTVIALAEAAYDERHLPSGHLDPQRLAILADALEDVGCDDEAIVSHLRSLGPHTRGCFVVDLLLEKV